MAKHTTYCVYLSDVDMPYPWHPFETRSPFAKLSWRALKLIVLNSSDALTLIVLALIPVSGFLYLASV